MTWIFYTSSNRLTGLDITHEISYLMIKRRSMKKYIVILVLCLAFLAPVVMAKDKPEEVVFESVLKDAVFMYAQNGDLYTTWTLKFENGAVIQFRYEDKSTFPPIWWVGKTYVVSKWSDGDFFIVRLKDEAPAK